MRGIDDFGCLLTLIDKPLTGPELAMFGEHEVHAPLIFGKNIPQTT